MCSSVFPNNSIQEPFDDRIYASGGLKTTLPDLSRFMMAYLNKGELDGQRILEGSTIEDNVEIQNEVSGTCLLWNASFRRLVWTLWRYGWSSDHSRNAS